MGGPISGAGGGAVLSTATPQPPGVADPGSTGEASDAGHVHDRELPDPRDAHDGQVPTTTSGAYVLAVAVALSDYTPAALGTASPGLSAEASRADHVHEAPAPAIPLLAGAVSTVLGADTVAGYGYVDPTGLASLTLAAVGQVVSGVTGTLDLYDLTAAAVVATLTWTETVATRKTASVTVPGTARLYELRVRKSGGADSDYALFSSASMIGS